MSDEKRIMPEAWTAQIDGYLDKVEKALMSTDASRATRRSVAEMVEDQIAEMCRTKLDDDSTDQDFHAMFSQLDRPESFAEEFEIVISPEPTLDVLKPRYSKLAILSSCLTVLFAFAIVVGLLEMSDNRPLESFLECTVFFALVAPIAGWFAMRQFETPNKMLRGERLAEFGFYAPLMIIANAIVLILATAAPLVPIVLGSAVMLGFLNWYLFRAIRFGIAQYRSNRELKHSSGEFAAPSGVV